MNKVEMVKGCASLVCSIGSGMVVNNIVNSTTPGKITLVAKGFVAAGGFVLSNMVSEKSAEYVEEKIDEVVNGFKNMVKEVESKTKKVKEEA